ncbi:hypothetical protein CIB48_g8188 [Xylaria polymorpha]|nr:hypothetical protein CIB48_g8188 [Xylaria polymorpha]
MESWAGYNYYTSNSTTWVQLMNLSTAEFGLGFLPRGVRAVPGAFHTSDQFPNDTYVIENADRGQGDEGKTAQIVFGAATAAAILFAVIWLVFNFKTMLHPRNSKDQDLLPRPNSPTSHSTAPTELMAFQDNQLCEASNFENQIFNFYYEFVYTEVELAEKPADEVINVEDIEAVTDLVRKMYSYDLLLYGLQSTRAYPHQRHDLTSKSDEILGAVREKISNEWANDLNSRVRMGWNDEEWEKISALKGFLQYQLPPLRYPNN